MEINWKAEVDKHFDDYLEDLTTLLRVKSVRDDDAATEDAPVGPGPKEALETFLSIAERDGFTTKNVANLAGRVEYGEGDETLGILGHVDVVPVDDAWETDPFEPVIKDDKIYARGSSDDKGPMLACYYGLKMIKELGLPVSKKVHFIVGTDEESDWKGVTRYFETEPMPDFGFSPDAEFPIINGEKGIFTMLLHFPALGTGALKAFAGGQRDNMVPGDAEATITGVSVEDAKAKAEVFNGENPVKVTVKAGNGDEVIVHVEGKVSHGAQPENGHNASTYLAVFLRTLSDELKKDQYLTFIEERLHTDFDGEKLGIKHHDDVMGDLSENPGVFKPEADGQMISVNCRVPRGLTFAEIDAIVDKHGEKYGFTRTDASHLQEPHYCPPTDPLVTTLLDVWKEHSGQPGHEQVIGGGTYGRLFERGVAYGAAMPGAIDTMHQPNEFEPLDTLRLSMAIYADAIYRLIK
ncbi:MAG: dipeptidase PepV [Aerococcus sp.]|nr:dipeptidase PepV [Aerococcus sp.]